MVPCSILSPGHLGLDHLGVQREVGGGALCAGPSRGKDAVQGARTVVSPSLTTWNLRGPRLGLETPGGLKGCLDLPGQCPEAKLNEKNTQAPRPLSRGQ